MRLWLPVAILLLWLLAALLGPLLSASANRIELEQMLAGPAADAWLGYDELGRPVLQRLVAGARTSFLVAVSVVSLSLAIGTFIGIVSAWLGGLWDHVIVRVGGHGGTESEDQQPGAEDDRGGFQTVSPCRSGSRAPRSIGATAGPGRGARVRSGLAGREPGPRTACEAGTGFGPASPLLRASSFPGI